MTSKPGALCCAELLKLVDELIAGTLMEVPADSGQAPTFAPSFESVEWANFISPDGSWKVTEYPDFLPPCHI